MLRQHVLNTYVRSSKKVNPEFEVLFRQSPLDLLEDENKQTLVCFDTQTYQELGPLPIQKLIRDKILPFNNQKEIKVVRSQGSVYQG